jgi:hypothetical protein
MYPAFAEESIPVHLEACFHRLSSPNMPRFSKRKDKLMAFCLVCFSVLTAGSFSISPNTHAPSSIGSTARTMFLNSGLPVNKLEKIWYGLLCV